MKCSTAVTDFPVTRSWSKLAAKKVVVITLIPRGLGMEFLLRCLHRVLLTNHDFVLVDESNWFFGSIPDKKMLDF